MRATTSLHDLIATLASAVSSAQDMVERHYLSLVRRYFDAEGRPLTMSIELPALSTAATPGETRQVQVPVLALVESRALGIRHVDVTLEVELDGLGDPPAAAAPAAAGAPLCFLGSDPAPGTGAGQGPQPAAAAAPVAPPNPAMSIRLPSGGSSGPTARVSMRVEERPASEAMARLTAQLNSLI